MHRKFLPAFVTLLIFFALALLWLWQSGDTPSTVSIPSFTDASQAEQVRPERALPDQAGSGAEQALEAPEPTASPVWSPPAVFAQVGTPSPQIPYPRGAHASRRYHDLVSREIDPQLLLQDPAVLAKLPRDGRLSLLAGEMDAHTKQAVRMVFDPTALDQIVQGQTAKLLVPTPGEEVLTLEFETVKTRSANTHTLQGHIAGEETSSAAQIVYHDGILHGNVMRYSTGQELEYRILADGHMMVRELDHSSMTDQCATCSGDIMASIVDEDSPVDKGEYVIRNSEEVTPRDTIGWRTVDVVIGYGQEARIADGGFAQIEARIIDAVDRVTGAFANSGIADAELMLLGTIEDPDYRFSDTSASNMNLEISALRTTNGSDGGALDTVTDFTTQLGGDLTSFIILEGRGGTAGVQSADKYSIVSRTNMTPGRMTFAHEIGHCLGTGHAWGDTSNAVNSVRYAWRYTAPDDGQAYRTIVSYNNGIGGVTIPYYSNPNISFMGAPTGAAAGYDLSTDPNATGDPIFIEENGIRGFDGTNPALGANNASLIDNGNPAASDSGLAHNSSHATRTNFEVINPVTADRWEKGTTQTIKFNGGDMKDLATIKLYKGGLLHTTFATDVNPATHRNFQWTVPFTHDEGTDFMIQVELVQNGSTITADSGIFEIYSDLPHVISQATTAEPQGLGPVTELVLNFNVPMNPATFDVGTDIISFTDPDGTSVLSLITGTSWSASDTALTLALTPPSAPGTYQLVIGPDIEDTAGNAMDQDQDGTTGESLDDRHTVNFQVLPALAYYADMESDPNWTFSANNPVDGWGFGQPTGGSGPTDGSSYNTGYGVADPTSGYNGPNVIGYNLGGDYERGISTTRWATTPVIDCSAHENVKLRFQQWLGVYTGGGANGDNAYIEVSNDGSTWTTIYHNDNVEVEDTDWQEVEFDISAVADGQPTVYVRWGMGKTNSSFNDDSCGWNIDEVLVFGDVLDGILLFSPDGGESYYAGSTVDLSWASVLGGNVQIELLKNGIVDSTISASTANDGAFEWQIPAGLASGADYRIRITSLDDPLKTAESAANFEMISILVTSPNGGESYYAGLTANLTWASSMGGNVKIELLKNGSVDSTITASTVNDNSHAWPIPVAQTPGTDYRIRVTSLEHPSEISESAADFTIISTLVTSPSGGERFYHRATESLTWVSNLGGNVKIELLKNGAVDSTIISSTPNDGSYTWEVPAGQTPGADYRIRITSLEVPAGIGQSEADFSILARPSAPYSESFASGLGDWEQESTDDIDWTLRSGGTPSGSTGPSDGQEGTGDDYLYTESSGSAGNPGKLARISCLFDLRAVTQSDFSFYYHMYGAAMGTLLVEASTDGLVWTELFTLSGDQGNAWIPVTVSLNDFAGGFATIRISGTTGTSFTSDIAVDSFAITGSGAPTFSEWIAGYSVGGLTAPGDDFDKDGIPNAIENYFGTNPGTFNAGLSVGQATTGGSQTFEFTHPINSTPASDITAVYRWSKDLSSFHNSGDSDTGTTVTFTASDPVDDIVTVTATITGTDTDRLFVTIQVTQE